MVERATPVAVETSVTPPWPRGRVSDATNNRRLFSSRCGDRASNRRRMFSIVSMPRVNHISIPGGIPQRQNDSPVSQRTLSQLILLAAVGAVNDPGDADILSVPADSDCAFSNNVTAKWPNVAWKISV